MPLKMYLGSTLIGGGGVQAGIDAVIDARGDWASATDATSSTGATLAAHSGVSSLSSFATAASIVASTSAITAAAGSSSAAAGLAASHSAITSVVASPFALAKMLAGPSSGLVWDDLANAQTIWDSRVNGADFAAFPAVTTSSDVPSVYPHARSLQLTAMSTATNTLYPDCVNIKLDLTGVSTLKIWMKYGVGSGYLLLTVNSTTVYSTPVTTTWTQYSIDVTSYTGTCTLKFGGRSRDSTRYYFCGITLA